MDEINARLLTEWRAVLIAYRPQDVKPYICLSNFLRICGIIVGDGKVNAEKIKISTQDFDVVININGAFEFAEPERFIIDIYPYQGMESQQTDDSQICENTVLSVLEKLENQKLITASQYEVFRMIAHVYKTYELRLQEYNCQYYWHSKEIAREVYKSLISAETKLYELEKQTHEIEMDDLVYVQYARCYIAKRACEMIRELGEESIYSSKAIIAALKSIIEKKSEFITVYFLLGSFMENVEENIDEAFEYYYLFLDKCANKCYNNEVYYRLGKLCEGRRLFNKSRIYFTKSYMSDSGSYRAKYKIAEYLEMKLKEFLKAIDLYKEIITELEYLLERGELQPIDLEYLFKVYFRCGRIFLKKFIDIEKAKYYFNKEETLAKINVSQMPFMEMFYGERAEFYLNQTKMRFPMYQIRINQQEALDMENKTTE